MRVAVSGHRGLPVDAQDLVRIALHEAVRERAGSELVGLSCLADGPDAWFAQSVLDLGGRLVAVVPAEQYRDGLPTEHHPTYDALLARAAQVLRVNHVESTSEAHMEASERMLAEADELVAVWDGKPARGYGGTADVVAAARNRAVPVVVFF